MWLVFWGGLLAVHVLQRRGFDFGQVFWPCGFRVRTGLPCITCGMTRSVLALGRGDVLTALRLQPAAAFLGLLGLAWGAVGGCIALTGRVPAAWSRLTANLTRWRMLLLLAGVLLAGWAVTFTRAWVGRG